MLQVIVAILSLLLLTGAFGSGMDAGDDASMAPAGNAGADHCESHFDGLP